MDIWPVEPSGGWPENASRATYIGAQERLGAERREWLARFARERLADECAGLDVDDRCGCFEWIACDFCEHENDRGGRLYSAAELLSIWSDTSHSWCPYAREGAAADEAAEDAYCRATWVVSETWLDDPSAHVQASTGAAREHGPPSLLRRVLAALGRVVRGTAK